MAAYQIKPPRINVFYTMVTVSNILKYATTLSAASRQRFYARLGFALTISVRSIWSDAVLSDADKIEAIKIVNELSHQIFNWMTRLGNSDETFNDRDCFEDIRNLSLQNWRAGGEIGTALLSTYNYFLSRKGAG